MTKKKESADKKYADGTTYKDSEGKTHRRVSSPGTPRGDAYCARTVSQKRTPKVKARRKAWGCSGQKSVKRKVAGGKLGRGDGVVRKGRTKGRMV
jgi:hypothetical protein